jgi:hypothetical protein
MREPDRVASFAVAALGPVIFDSTIRPGRRISFRPAVALDGTGSASGR